MSKYAEAARQRGEARSANVAEKVLKAIRAIRAEMKENGGIYPANGGAVSKNEVARRAGIHTTTLFSPKQKRLGNRVGHWLDLLKRTETVGRERVRRSHAERAEDWETRYKIIATHLALANLKTQAAESELEQALRDVEKEKAEIARLREINANLLEQLSHAGATSIKPLPRGGNR